MGRGGGSGSGGSRGSSSGGSRGFSSRRSSSSSSHRGGGSPRGSSGSFGSGGSFSGGGGYRPGSSRPGGPMMPPPMHSSGPRGNYSGGMMGGGFGGGRVGGGIGCSGCLISLVIMIAVIIIAISSLGIGSTGMHSVQNVATAREKLSASSVTTSSQWIDDELGWLNSQKSVVNAMQYFYDETGVQPYLLITDQMNGKGEDITDSEAEDYLSELYDSLYDDEGHMIFVFMEYEESEYITYIYTGRAADTVIDSDAREILLDNADRYYTDSSLSDDEFFAKIFRSSADEIMSGSGAATAVNGAFSFIKKVLIGILAVIIVIVIIVVVLFIKDRKKKEREELRKMAETPVSETKSSIEEELENKYQ